MFACNNRDIPALSNYAEALRHWEKTRPWRGHSANDPRPLGQRSHRAKTIRLGNNEQVHCTLYRTDVVTFYKDGTVEVDNDYKSRSTDDFISRVLARTPLYFCGNKADPVVWSRYNNSGWIDGHLFEGDVCCFDADWKVTNVRSFKIPRLNMKRFNELKRALRYTDYLTWLKAYQAMGGEVFSGYWTRRNEYHDVSHDLAKGGEHWAALARNVPTAKVLETILRENPSVIDTTECDVFENDRAYKSWIALDAKYGRFV